MGPTLLTAGESSIGTRYSIHVRHLGRWIRATQMDSLREAQIVAETAHRRSGLPIEVRNGSGAVSLAFEPFRAALGPAVASAISNGIAVTIQ